MYSLVYVLEIRENYKMFCILILFVHTSSFYIVVRAFEVLH